MAENTKKLAEFVHTSKFSNLPTDVIHQTKRTLLDAVGCAIAGRSMQAAKLAIELAIRLGGPKESTIIGSNAKVACNNAAFANGQLINAQDFDPGSIEHDSAGVIAGALALAEATGASGKDFRGLSGVFDREKAELCIFLTLKEPTKPMEVEAATKGFYKSPLGKDYPKIQILTIEELLQGKKPEIPPWIAPMPAPPRLKQSEGKSVKML